MVGYFQVIMEKDRLVVNVSKPGYLTKQFLNDPSMVLKYSPSELQIYDFVGEVDIVDTETENDDDTVQTRELAIAKSEKDSKALLTSHL